MNKHNPSPRLECCLATYIFATLTIMPVQQNGTLKEQSCNFCDVCCITNMTTREV